MDEGAELRELDDGLIGLAIGKCAGAEDKGVLGDGLLNGWVFLGVGEDFRRAYGGAGFAPVGFVGGNDGKILEAEVGHGAGYGADVERVARGGEDDSDAVALGGGEQEYILVSGC